MGMRAEPLLDSQWATVHIAEKVFAPPSVTAKSSARALRVGDALAAKGARMYGAYWCSHCFGQKQTLGKEAFSRVEYVECAKDGAGSRNALCKSRKVPGYPTWEIDGVLHEYSSTNTGTVNSDS